MKATDEYNFCFYEYNICFFLFEKRKYPCLFFCKEICLLICCGILFVGSWFEEVKESKDPTRIARHGRITSACKNRGISCWWDFLGHGRRCYWGIGGLYSIWFWCLMKLFQSFIALDWLKEYKWVLPIYSWTIMACHILLLFLSNLTSLILQNGQITLERSR